MFLDASSDVRSFVSQLVAAERAPMDALLKSQKANFQRQLDAYNAISKKIQSFRDALLDLKKADSFTAFKTSTSADGYAQVTASAGAAAGVYSIHVNQLASAHQVSLDFSDESWVAPSSGALDIDLGGESFSIDFSGLPAGATLTDLRSAINQASDNPGVKATLVRTGSSVKLLLTSENTGAANTIGLNTTVGAADPQMTELETAVAGAVEISPAQDAEITLGTGSPITITSGSNELDDVIGGLNITLTKAHADPAGQLQITVEKDDEAVREQLDSFVKEYNGLIDTLKKYTAQGEDGSRAVLSGDSTSRLLQLRLRSEFNNLAGGLTLGALGIEADSSGKLSIDDAKLGNFIGQNPDGLTNALSGSTGLMASLDTILKPYVFGSNAALKARSNSMQSSLERISERQAQLDTRMGQIFNRYLTQFTNMQNLVTQMQQTSSMFG